jgi:hypothetical protein
MDERIVKAYHEYLNTNVTSPVAAQLVLCQILLEMADFLATPEAPTSNITSLADVTPADPADVRTQLWAARNPEQAAQTQQEKLQALANEAFK